MATHSTILAWRIPWREEPGRLQSIGLKQSDTTKAIQHIHTNPSYDNQKCLQTLPKFPTGRYKERGNDPQLLSLRTASGDRILKTGQLQTSVHASCLGKIGKQSCRRKMDHIQKEGKESKGGFAEGAAPQSLLTFKFLCNDDTVDDVISSFNGYKFLLLICYSKEKTECL